MENLGPVLFWRRCSLAHVIRCRAWVEMREGTLMRKNEKMVVNH